LDIRNFVANLFFNSTVAMLLLGIDIGTSFVKVSVIESETLACIASQQYPETESPIISRQPGWAEQTPEDWWQQVKMAIVKMHLQYKYKPNDISAIGITYQMHGLVITDKNQQALRNSIIWCDSRAVEIGNNAFNSIGNEKCLQHLLNSPGNFTASKLAWVKQHEPDIYSKIDKVMLPGDFIAMKLTGEISTSIAALSEGIFWDFKNNELSKDLMQYYGFEHSFIPHTKNVFEEHGRISSSIAETLSLKEGIPVSYKAGDQPNNALSLNVLEPGEVAATAGTSGVIYGVTDKPVFDKASRINSFAHVNYSTGILNSWLKKLAGGLLGYEQMNRAAMNIKAGSNGLKIFPFGNGAERMLGNKNVKAHIRDIDLNVHNNTHLFRAAQEGIAFAFRYGLDIMKENGFSARVIRAGKANMFLSDVFTNSLVNTLDVPVELYNCDGSMGAAIGAGIGAGVYASAKDAFANFKPVQLIQQEQARQYNDLYEDWKNTLEKQLTEQ
jgi:xylulokinase